jgi:hypothetical protein
MANDGKLLTNANVQAAIAEAMSARPQRTANVDNRPAEHGMDKNKDSDG